MFIFGPDTLTTILHPKRKSSSWNIFGNTY